MSADIIKAKPTKGRWITIHTHTEYDDNGNATHSGGGTHVLIEDQPDGSAKIIGGAGDGDKLKGKIITHLHKPLPQMPEDDEEHAPAPEPAAATPTPAKPKKKVVRKSIKPTDPHRGRDTTTGRYASYKDNALAFARRNGPRITDQDAPAAFARAHAAGGQDALRSAVGWMRGQLKERGMQPLAASHVNDPEVPSRSYDYTSRLHYQRMKNAGFVVADHPTEKGSKAWVRHGATPERDEVLPLPRSERAEHDRRTALVMRHKLETAAPAAHTAFFEANVKAHPHLLKVEGQTDSERHVNAMAIWHAAQTKGQGQEVLNKLHQKLDDQHITPIYPH